VSRVPCPGCGNALAQVPLLEGVDRMSETPARAEVCVCGRCGSGRTLPLVPTRELGRLYPRLYASHGLPRRRPLRIAATVLFRARYGWALRGGTLGSLRREPAGRLLDVGSGRGDLGVVLGGRGWQVTGLEPTPEAAAEARSRGVPTEEGTLTDAGGTLADESYDVVVFQHSLEHVVEPADDLAVARRLLKPGGLLIVSAPNFASWQRQSFGSGWFHLDLPRHRSHFTPAGLQEALRRSGFGRITIRTSTSADGLPMSLQYRLLGRRRLGNTGATLVATTALTFLLLPLTVALNALRGGGDILNAVAFKPAADVGRGSAA
jgi:SAM-dependent methyltransferase